MTIDDLVITNYREAGGLPLRNIMRLPKEEAFDLGKKLSEKTLAKRDRYGDYFVGYYEKRLRTEEWLYNAFAAAGGEPQTCHPIYFTLQEGTRMCDFLGNNEKIQISLNTIDSRYISFTPRDSTHLIDMGKTQDTVWRKETLFQMISESKQHINEFIKSIPENYGQPGGYVEVQLWNDDYIKDII